MASRAPNRKITLRDNRIRADRLAACAYITSLEGRESGCRLTSPDVIARSAESADRKLPSVTVADYGVWHVSPAASSAFL